PRREPHADGGNEQADVEHADPSEPMIRRDEHGADRKERCNEHEHDDDGVAAHGRDGGEQRREREREPDDEARARERDAGRRNPDGVQPAERERGTAERAQGPRQQVNCFHAAPLQRPVFLHRGQTSRDATTTAAANTVSPTPTPKPAPIAAPIAMLPSKSPATTPSKAPHNTPAGIASVPQ